MVFHSLAFLVFLPVTLLLYYGAKSPRVQNIILLLASYVFYGWWDWRFISLILASTLVDYYCARRIAVVSQLKQKKYFLWISLAVNLGALAYFKYANFFIRSFEEVLGAVGFESQPLVLQIILPVGISFYTFQSLSYTIDVYRGDLKPCNRFVDFALYVSFFPQLVAGPIERATNLLPRIQSERRFDVGQACDGVWLVLLGYLKKLVIADRLAQIADMAFSGPEAFSQTGHAMVYLYAFAFQIYADFSAYSDIARGIAKIMGFELQVNFKSPYLVRDPSAFWRNWHISLSTWLRDYLYIPLGGNKATENKTLRNLMITMLLGGLWHGAGAAYILWGLFHGVLLVIYRKLPKPPATGVRGLLHVVFFFHLTCVGWLLFRLGSVPLEKQIPMLGDFFSGLLSSSVSVMSGYESAVVLLGLAALLIQYQHETMESFSKWRSRWQIVLPPVALCVVLSLGVFGNSSFIYFQF